MRFFAAVAALCLLTGSLWAQGAASLRGVVSDPQKASIGSAKVTLTETESGSVRQGTTSASGEYEFLQVRPGSYVLRVEAPGFSLSEVKGITLLVDTPATVDVAMQLASSATTVSVVAEATQLNTVDASIGNAFQERQIQSLPLQTRNVVQLLSLQPGVTQTGEVMGARRDQNNILLDGIDNNDNQNPLSGQNGTNPASNSGQGSLGFNSALPIPLDSVQEFRVTVAGQNAFDGHSSGGQVVLVTRSGSNDLHGSAYEYNRNTDYTANNWFSNRAGLPRQQLVRNQFGASLGGPIKKNRLFYFGNYERRIDASQTATTRTVPSDALKNGDIVFKTSDGATHTLTPADIAIIDPLHIGVSQTILSYLKQFPEVNSPVTGTNNDGGLNFGGYLFNAPVNLDFRTYVARMDWIVDQAGKHTVSFRATLSNNGNTQNAAEFPGQQAASTLLSDNRGFGLRYTALLTPSLTNTANVGVTRIGYSATGSTAPSVTLGAESTFAAYTPRPTGRVNPTWNFNDELNWVKGRHTVTGGINFRWIDNRVLSYSNSFPSYAFSRGVLVGLGNDIYGAALNYVANGNSALKLSNSTAVTNAFGTLLGVLNSITDPVQYAKDGSVLAAGVPRSNDFVTHEYEGYLQDSWKISPQLTLTYGVHYEYDSVPYEVNGLSVGTTPGLNTYFADRVGAANAGIPGNQILNSDLLTYALNGPVNGKAGWYSPDKNNFAPRLGLAYSIDSKTVFRAGAGVTYDQFGNDMAVNLANSGSPGLSTTVSNASFNFSTAPRYGTGVLPALPASPSGGYPYTPPLVNGISGTFFGVDPSLHAPYTYLLNMSVQREVARNYVLEVGYAGRLSRAGLVQEDAFAPEIYFKDPQSGVTWVQNDTTLANMYNAGLTPAAVKANPSLVPNMPFVQDMFPALANQNFTGSASANYFYDIYSVYAGSHLDNLHALDRVTSAAYPNCIVKTGCFTFFAPQGSTDWFWTNAGNANYHAMVVTLRHSLARGFAFDFNYTWSHSIDNGSGTASGSATSTTGSSSTSSGIIQNPFVPSANRGDSTFDYRHLFNANFVYQLPFGKGRTFFNNAPRWVDEVIGGWQVSGLIRTQSGAPVNITGDGVFNLNYWFSSDALPINGVKPAAGLTYDQNGNPGLFANTGVLSQFADAGPGIANPRSTYRLPWQNNVDLTAMKDIHLPWEHHTLQFRADAFNAFNTVNFTGISLSLQSPSSFGEFTTAQDARVLQLALRYSF